MLSVVILSISASFAADDVTDDVIAIDDEITIDEPLAVEETPTVSANESTVVTKDTFSNYFDENGTLYANVTAEELTFSGDISDVGVNTIVLDRQISLIGENSTLTNIAIDIKSNNVTITGFTLIQNNGTAAISVSNASNVVIENNNIDFKAVADSDGYAVNADLAGHLNLLNNVITYIGSTNSSGINNGIRVSNSNGSTIKGNKFTLSLVSSYVPWAEVPAGSGNWVSSPVSEGIVVDSSESISFEDNTVDVTYSTVVGSYDTIYSVSFKNSDYAVISANNITAKGHTYIYGIQISGENFNINNNTIAVESDNYYADGIDIEGPASGVVDNNVISAKGVQSAYPIYSGMNGQNVSGYYIDNTISGEAYFVLGMSLGDVDSTIINNTIDINGNYTTGIAYRGSLLIADGNRIILNSSEQGNESVWEAFGVETVGIKVVQGNATISENIITGSGKGISLDGNGTDAILYKNFINIIGKDDKDAYAIYADNVNSLSVKSNGIDYQGTTQGTGINNAVYVNNVSDARINGNTFSLDLVSSYVPWAEVPAGSGNWVSSPVSEGIVIENSEAVQFSNNNVTVTYDDVVGSYDTIYSVSFKNSDYALISENNITANGHTYIYGVQISGENFNIDSNVITVESDNYYANGIDIEGPASGVVVDNGISAKGVQLAYPIYSGMNGQNVSVLYMDNDLVGQAYFIIGMSLGDVESDINGNMIIINGNYSTGIASIVKNLTIHGNAIIANASNIGNESVWESFGVETVGIKVASGLATIYENTVDTTGVYTVKVSDTNSSVYLNKLVAENLTGDASVNYTGNATVKDNYAVSSLFKYDDTTTVLLTAVKKGAYYKLTLLDENGNVLANKNVTYILSGIDTVIPTDSKGVVSVKLVASKASTQTLTFIFDGDSTYGPTEAIATVKITKEKTKLTAKNKAFKAKTKTKKYKVVLKDSNKKAIKNVKVAIKVNGKKYKAVTNKKGKATFKITKLTKKGTYKAKVKFAGNKYYKAAKKTVKIKVKK